MLAGAGGFALAVALGGFVYWRYSSAPARPAGCADAARTSDERALCVSNISFSRQGSGGPIVLLHALGLSRRAWDPVVEDLAKRHTVLTPDLPGFGLSPAVPGAPDVANLTDALLVWLRDAGIERPHVVGNSLGGGIAIELGRLGAAQSVTALSPIGFWSEAERIYSSSVITAIYAFVKTLPGYAQTMAKREEARPLLFGFFFAQSDALFPEYASAIVDDVLRAQALPKTLAACQTYVTPEHRTIAPTTIAWGADDRVLIGSQDRRARDVMPTAKHVLLPGCGHICAADDPDLVVATIEDTISAAEKTG